MVRRYSARLGVGLLLAAAALSGVPASAGGAVARPASTTATTGAAPAQSPAGQWKRPGVMPTREAWTAHLPPRVATSPAAGPTCAPIVGSTCGDLVNHGGPVMAAPETFAVFWNPPGSVGLTAAFESAIASYIADVGGSTFAAILGQYGVVQPFTSGGGWVDTTAFPRAGTQAQPLLDSDIQAEVTRALSNNPAWGPPGLGRLFAVFLPKGVYLQLGTSESFTGTGAFCAYHQSFLSGTAAVIYAAMPYVGTDAPGCDIQGATSATVPHGDLDTDSEISTLSHEQFEAFSDPEPNTNTAWSDPNGYEIGDLCAYVYGPQDAGFGDVRMSNHDYLTQGEWSNAFDASTPNYQNACSWAADLTVSAPTGMGAWSGLPVTVAAHNSDIAGSPLASQFHGTVRLTFTDTSIVPPADYQFVPASDAGAHAIVMTFNEAGCQPLSVTEVGGGGLGGSGILSVGDTSACTIGPAPAIQRTSVEQKGLSQARLTLPQTPTSGDLLVVATLADLGKATPSGSWSTLLTIPVGAGDSVKTLSVYARKVSAGDGQGLNVTSNVAGDGVEGVLYELPNLSGVVDASRVTDFVRSGPVGAGVAGLTGDTALVLFVDTAGTPVNAVTGGAGTSTASLIDSHGHETGMQLGLSAAVATLTAPTGTVSLRPLRSIGLDGAVVAVALHP